MQSGYNSTRRNRNIGTSQQGHGQNNRLRIASPNAVSGAFWEQLTHYVSVRRRCSNRDMIFLVEEPRKGYFHACSVDDVALVLSLLPPEDIQALKGVVFRQPKRKEEILRPSWGRMDFSAIVGRPQDGSVSGPVLFLDAQRSDLAWNQAKSVRIQAQQELRRLEEDGHKVLIQRSRIRVETSLTAIRATQLYRTLAHEIGHLVDYSARSALDNDYWDRPPQERESFAHRYADAFRARMFEEGLLPFPPIPTVLTEQLTPELGSGHGLGA